MRPIFFRISGTFNPLDMMLIPSTTISPCIFMPSWSSSNLLNDFKRVVFPHPDGPMMAVSCFAGISMSIFFNTGLLCMVTFRSLVFIWIVLDFPIVDSSFFFYYLMICFDDFFVRYRVMMLMSNTIMSKTKATAYALFWTTWSGMLTRLRIIVGNAAV